MDDAVIPHFAFFEAVAGGIWLVWLIESDLRFYEGV